MVVLYTARLSFFSAVAAMVDLILEYASYSEFLILEMLYFIQSYVCRKCSSHTLWSVISHTWAHRTGAREEKEKLENPLTGTRTGVWASENDNQQQQPSTIKTIQRLLRHPHWYCSHSHNFSKRKHYFDLLRLVCIKVGYFFSSHRQKWQQEDDNEDWAWTQPAFVSYIEESSL